MSRMLGQRKWPEVITVVPGIGVALLSKFACPICIAAYAGVLSSLGLSVLTTRQGLTITTVALLLAGISSLWWSARCHGHSGPLVLALAGSILLLVGRLMWNAPPILLSGGAAVFVVSVWNLRYVRWRKQVFVRLGRSDSASHISDL
jgi:hypothetical protein